MQIPNYHTERIMASVINMQRSRSQSNIQLSPIIVGLQAFFLGVMVCWLCFLTLVCYSRVEWGENGAVLDDMALRDYPMGILWNT